MEFEGSPETREHHADPSGRYCLELMVFVVRWKIAHLTLGALLPLFLDTENLIQPHNALRIYDSCCLGIFVSKLQRSWATFSMFKAQILLLDSTALPQTGTEDCYVHFLTTWPTHNGLARPRRGWQMWKGLCQTRRCRGRWLKGARNHSTGHVSHF